MQRRQERLKTEKLLGSLLPPAILKQMKNGEFDVVDECLGDVKEIVVNLYMEYTNLEDKIIKQYENLGKDNIFEKNKIMFAMYNGKKYGKLIWNLIK